MHRHKALRGQTLLEVLIAMTVMAIVSAALISTVLLTQKASVSAKNKTEATKYAQQISEQLRAMRDVKGTANLFASGYTGPGPGNDACASIDTSAGSDPSLWNLTQIDFFSHKTSPFSCPTDVTKATAIPGTIFSYGIWIQCNDQNFCKLPNQVNYEITVFWQEAGQQFSVNQTGELTQWAKPGTVFCTYSPANPSFGQSITVNAYGGVGSYTWISDGGTPVSGGPTASNPITSSLKYGYGAHNMTITDSVGNSGKCVITVNP